MDVDEFVEHYPRLFHMTELGGWETIGQHGLLSVRAILNRFQIGDPLRGRLETQRPAPVRLSHPAHGEVLIRDQLALQETKLARCLTDMTVAEWNRSRNQPRTGTKRKGTALATERPHRTTTNRRADRAMQVQRFTIAAWRA